VSHSHILDMLTVAQLVIKCPLLLRKDALPYTAEVKGRVKLYFCCAYVPSWQVKLHILRDKKFKYVMF
jgi:hypothetical protein